jgi:hypothetical protein
MSFYRYLRAGRFFYYNGLGAMLTIVALLVFFVLRMDAIFWIIIYTWASILFASTTGNYLRWQHYKQFHRKPRLKL